MMLVRILESLVCVLFTVGCESLCGHQSNARATSSDNCDFALHAKQLVGVEVVSLSHCA